MAIGISVLTEGAEDTDNTTFTTASVSPAAGSVVLLTVMNFENSSTQPAIDSVSGCGLTWTVVREQNVDPTGSDRATVHLWKGLGTPSTGTITVDWSGANTVRRPSWIVHQVTGADTTTPIVQHNGVTAGSAGTSGNVSFTSAFADATNNATFAVYGVQQNSETDATTVDANLTKITWEAVSYSHQTTAWKIGEESNVDGSWPSGRWGIIIAEIAAAAAAGDEFTESPVDNVGISDSVAKTVGLGRIDNVGVTDNIAIQRGIVRTDPVGLTDTVHKSILKSITDSIGITDSVEVLKARLDIYTESIGVTDSVTFGRGKGFVDSMQIQDSIVIDRHNTIVDSVGITDYFSAVIPIKQNVTDNVGITDSFTADLFQGHVKESFMSLVDDKRELCIAYLVAQAVDTEANLRLLSIHDLAHMYWSHQAGDFAARMLRSIHDHMEDVNPELEGWDWLTAIT